MDTPHDRPDIPEGGGTDDRPPSDELRKALRDLYARGPEIPTEVDERILAMARRQMGAPQPAATDSPAVIARIGPRRWRVGGAIGTLAAASIAVAVWIALPDAERKDQIAFESPELQAPGEGLMANEESFAPGRRARRESAPAQRTLEQELEQDLANAAAPSSSVATKPAPATEPAPADEYRDRSLARADELADVGSTAFADDAREADAVDRIAKSAPLGALAAGAGLDDAPAGLLGDVDASGTLDILDAFALARAIERGERLSGLAWDANGDGRVDADDVTAIAIAAVSIDQPRSDGGAS